MSYKANGGYPIGQKQLKGEKMRLWIDTDIGDDIDDILAISWALKKGVEIVGISTVYREAEKRLNIVKELLEVADKKEINLYAGYSSVITNNPIPLGKLNYKSALDVEESNPETAVDALIAAVEKYEDLTVLIIGAQTNIAKACLKAPETMKKAKLLIMGGAFYVHTAEWNIVEDPKAAEIVSKCGADITYIPWDITRTSGIGQENYQKILAIDENTERGVVANFVKQWSERNKYIPLLHDPAAFYYCLREDLFELIDVRVKIVGEGEFMGLTLNLNDYTFRHDKAVEYPTIKLAVKANNDVIIADFMKDVFGIV